MASLSNTQNQFLKQLAATVARPLNIAWLLSILSSLLFIWQAWLLASLFATWLNNYFYETPLSVGVSPLWIIGLLICFTLRPLLSAGRELICSRASLKVRHQLRESLLASMAILGPNLRYFGSDGSLSSQIIDQTDALDGFISRFNVQKKISVSTPILLLIAVAWQSYVAAFLLFITAPLVPVFMILIGQMTRKKSAEQFSALAQLSGRFLDWVRGMPTLKRLQATSIASLDLTVSSEDYRRRTMDVLKIAFLNGAILELLAALSIALVAVYLGFGLMGILPWDKGQVPVDYFGALYILLLAPEFYLPLRQLGSDYHAKAQAEGAVQSLLPVIEAAKQNHSKTIKVADTDSIKADINLTVAFAIEFNNVSITSLIPNTTKKLSQQPMESAVEIAQQQKDKNYSNQNLNKPMSRTRLAPISFKVEAGQRTGLTGSSGSGKSSLLQSLMGFVSFAGDINVVVDDQRISLTAIDMDQFRQHVGYLAQQVALMPLTILENLRLAKQDATDEDIIQALIQVELWTLIEQLPNGIHTPLGERGQGLSGGQLQRLGIAQLLLRDDSLWLLDEPTEHLDPDTASRIHSILEKVSKDKTVIWITHNIQQLPWLDNVINLQVPVSHLVSHTDGADDNDKIKTTDPKR